EASNTEFRQRVKSLCGKLSAGDRRLLLHYNWQELEAAPREEQESFLNLLSKEADPDPWIKDMIAGRIEIKLAWDSRGGGWANTVTEQGWKGFFAHLTLARDCLVRAWKLDPSLPEAPSDMITVCMGAGERLGEDATDWFQRALDAQVDYVGAYQRIRLDL